MHSEITKDGLDVNGSVARPWRDISGQRAAASISAATSSVSDLPNLRGRAKKVLMASSLARRSAMADVLSTYASPRARGRRRMPT